jgi:hypothetical protein
MSPLNRKETEDLIVDMYYNRNKTFREIQQIVRKSPRDIKIIPNRVEPRTRTKEYTDLDKVGEVCRT